MDCEIVLLVENIDVCRYFYRETLGLGEPVTDSAFQVVFALNENSSLVLERCGAAFLEHASSACRFTLKPENPAEFIRHLQEADLTVNDGFDRSGRKILYITDPEGNVIQILAQA